MKRSISFLTAAAAFGFATVSFGQTSPGPQPSDQAAPAQQQQMPSRDPSTTAPPPSQQPMPPGSESQGGEAAAAAPPPSADAAKRLAAVMPSGMSPQEACAEFRSLEECATALHLAQNINIPFSDLKSRLKNGERVSAIIHDAKPQADPKAEITRAQDQARADLGVPQG